MFGHASLPSQNYVFGASAPIGPDAAYVLDQMRKSHRYQNVLIGIERERRIAVRELLARQPEVAATNAAVTEAIAQRDAVLAEIAAANSAARTRRGAPNELRERAMELRAEVREKTAAAKAARQEACARLVDALKEIEAAAHAKTIAARGSSELYFGTYLDAENAAKGARTANDLPKFKQWDGDGKAGAQIQGGISFADALAGDDTRLRIEMLPRTGADRYAKVKIRVGSRGKGREPIWCEQRVRWHRDIPDHAQIKWAYSLRRRIGLTDHWYIMLTVSSADGFGRHDRAATGEMDLRLGWAATPAGLRVASWTGSDGMSGEVVVPGDIVRQLADCDGIAAVRRIRFDFSLAAMLAWARGGAMPEALAPDLVYLRKRLADERKASAHKAMQLRVDALERLIAAWGSPRPALPEKFAEQIKFAHAWKSSNKLAAMVYWLRDNRFAGNEALFDFLEQWRRHDKHLRNYEAHRRRKFAFRRREIFRLFAGEMRRRYATMKIKKIPLPKLAKYPKGEDPERVNAAARWNQRAASPGLLQGILREMGPSAEVVEAPQGPLEPVEA